MAHKLWVGALIAALGLAGTTTATDVHAQAKPKKQAGPASPPAPPTTKKAITVLPKGFAWGMSQKQVAGAVDKMLDDVYRPLFQKVSPGVKMKALDAQLAEEKNTFRRSRVDFGKLPTGIDATPLRGEYTHENGESLMTLARDKDKTHFFFIKDRLWKIITEHPLGEGAPHGKDLQEAVTKLAGALGVAGRVRPADFANGRNSTEVDWKDSTSHLRVIERGDDAIALAFEDNATLASLAALRTHVAKTDDGIDPDIAAIMRKPEEPGPPEKAPKK